MFRVVRLIMRRRVKIAKLMLSVAFLCPMFLFFKSRVSITSWSMRVWKRVNYPELVEGLGNFELPDEPPGTGPGEGGKPHNLRHDQEIDVNQSIQSYGMNAACSDEISLDRTIPDFRNEECKHWNYPEDLPKVSVIIAFHNEAFSVLMRTVHSVVNRTPLQFLEEVILVDDFSGKEDLKEKLESYIERWNGKVRLIRNEEREGLINTRSRGAREARGEIVVFLDAHSEVMKNWLPPLITPIYNNRTTMTVPIIESIDSRNFEIRRVYGLTTHWVGIFEWGFGFREGPLSKRELKSRKHFTDPYPSPNHAGGYFAINRKYFIEIGLYDPGLLLWGGENFELSFKVWLSGGTLLYIPCSRVAHVYRILSPYSWGGLTKKRKGNLVTGNYRRVVETWLDEKHKEYFYTRTPTAKYVEMGDISEQLKLKQRIQRRTFQWYMDNVAYDVLVQYPPPPPNRVWGFLRNQGTYLCVRSENSNPPSVMVASFCNREDQFVKLNILGELSIGEHCVISIRDSIYLHACLRRADTYWKYDNTTRAMRQKEKCMAIVSVDQEHLGHLSLLPCDPTDAKQQWEFVDVTHLLGF